jgi:hypothetical protein
VTKNATGIGVRGGANSQLDTNFLNRQETLLFSSTKAFSITGLTLGVIDNNDTLQIYGVNADDSLVSLGFDGVIKSGLNGAATFVNSGQNTTLTFNTPTARFTRYLFTTNERGDVVFAGDTGQGYLVGQINAVVPEPATWAMMIGGFGLVGFGLRRRRELAAA